MAKKYFETEIEAMKGQVTEKEFNALVPEINKILAEEKIASAIEDKIDSDIIPPVQGF